MQFIKSGIDFNIQLYKNEGLTLENDIFPGHFLMTICGKPGGGKTSLLKFIMTSEKLFYRKFDYVFVMSPSKKEYDSFFLPKENFCSQLDWSWIESKVKQLKNTLTYVNVLFILDDVISDLFESRTQKPIMDFIFNRRHLLDNGMVSIVLTSQKFTRVPTEIRSCTTVLIFFKLNNMCFKKIYDDLMYIDKNKFDEICENVFKEDKKGVFLLYRLDNNKLYKNFDNIII